MFGQKIELSGKLKKHFLTDKTNKTTRIILIEEERVISQDHLTSKTFSKYIS